MKWFLVFFLLAVLPYAVFSQNDSSHTFKNDSVLQEVSVTAFHSQLKWKAVPAAVAIITQADLNRYANTSLVPIFNIVPGVRMEERSPASYRLSVRGSLLRSPFGVRNLKVYWNEIPLTDAGGNTYLNLVDMNDLSSAEIIKGPAASMYGANTGGAVLLQSSLNTNEQPQHHFAAAYSGGSFGLFQQQTSWEYSGKTFATSIQQSHQQSDGYREQSATRKDVLKWQSVLHLTNHDLQFLLFYTDLYYQTPGGITLAQMQLNPKLSRQTAGSIPGSIQQKAAIYNKTIFGAVHDESKLSEHFVLKSFLSGNHTSFTNPFITNYEKRNESNFGTGTNLTYQTKTLHTQFQWVNGVEWLYNHSLINDFGNRSGVEDTVQFKDDISVTQWFAFSQAQYSIDEKWTITAGLSLNNQSFQYKRVSDPVPVSVRKSISSVLTPRLAVLYRLNNEVSLYMLAAKGFSPPALAEVRPSDGNYYGDLGAEYGWNYEAGIKGELLNRRLQFDVAAYFFSLQNAIVRRTNTNGAEYFVNAGGTRQNGVEVLVKYKIIHSSNLFIKEWNLWSSNSYQPYRFTDYQQSSSNYSGNELTGVPRNIWVTGMDVETNNGSYLNLSLNATSSLPLTDANDVYADGYQLAQIKCGYRYTKKGKSWHYYMGIDNLFNQTYSLGNDINAVGKRYYNPASGRNFFAGVQFRF